MRILFLLLLAFGLDCRAQHPLAFVNTQDVAYMRQALKTNPVLKRSFDEIKRSVDPWLNQHVDVPYPKDPQGGYTHDRHKENYMLVFNGGLLYQLTGDVRYANLARDIMLQYADFNPTLPKHPQATSSSPGHIFWQALNDANWLVYSGLGYDMIVSTLNKAQKDKIVNGAFAPEVNYFTHDLEPWFDLIHNHGVWACAGVGITGIATDRKDWTDMALRGSKLDGKAGFLAQMDQLFAPDGYYTEGPYYVRYALLPYYLFANALQKARPQLNIFQYRNQILRKALLAGFQQTNINGTFFPINDDLKDKDFTTNEMVTAIGIAWDVYGADPGLLSVAARQNKVLLNKGGAAIATALNTKKDISPYYPYTSVEFVDGAKGDEGGLTILRSGKAPALTSLIFKYASHGLSHGHYDQLGISLFDQGHEILQDYGSVRFIGVEQKYGGRYLKENQTYASQTIAHSTMVVDGKSHFSANEDIAQKFHGEKVYSILSAGGNFQAVSAREGHAYEGIAMQRSLFMIRVPGAVRPLVLDAFRVQSNGEHQYDLPFQYNGQVIRANYPYRYQAKSQEPMGTANGYQFLWKEAEAHVQDSLLAFTFLNANTYYTISSPAGTGTDVYFTRTGANDADFNLRREPSYILRRKGQNALYLSAIEIHGNFDPIAEFSSNSYPGVSELSTVQDDAQLTVMHVRYKGKDMLVAESKDGSTHEFQYAGQRYQFKAKAAAWYDQKQIQ